MSPAKTFVALGVFWGALIGIAVLAGVAPPPPRMQTASAADYGSHDGGGDSSDGEPPEQEPEGPHVATAADYAGHSDGPDPDANRPAGPRFSYNGAWTEPRCVELAPVDDIRAAYDPADKRASLLALARRRYPLGVPFIERMPDEAIQTFLPGNTFEALVADFDTLVHEGSHIWSAFQMGRDGFVYQAGPGDPLRLPNIDTFVRSEIAVDVPPGDAYRSVYLEGQSGEQGFETLLDEMNAYVHTLAASVCVRDLLPTNQRVSSRDGILAMMAYVGLYLRHARINHPEIYIRIQDHPEYAQMIMRLWERAGFWLAESAPYAALGVRDVEYAERASHPRITSEIEMLRRSMP